MSGYVIMCAMQIQIGSVETLGDETLRLQQRSNAPQRVVSKRPYFNGPSDGPQRLRKHGVIAAFDQEPDEYTGRRDALPEFYEYRDTGCEVSPSCLACPLERCRYDDFRGITKLRISERQQRVVELRRQGWSVERVAREMGVTPRTVYRLSKVGN